MTNEWLYDNKVFDLNENPNYLGFVYVITNLKTQKKYIGQKLFYKIEKRPPLKGMKRKRTRKVESDWRQYYGSNDVLKEDVISLGPDNFKREIIFLCKKKSEMNYLEMKCQVVNDVIIRDDFYNSFVGGKITRSQLQGGNHEEV